MNRENIPDFIVWNKQKIKFQIQAKNPFIYAEIHKNPFTIQIYNKSDKVLIKIAQEKLKAKWSQRAYVSMCNTLELLLKAYGAQQQWENCSIVIFKTAF